MTSGGGTGVGVGFATVGAGAVLGAEVVRCCGGGDCVCTGAVFCCGVGDGVGDGDLRRLYFVWLNAIEATNNDATVETMILVIIRRPVLNFNILNRKSQFCGAA